MTTTEQAPSDETAFSADATRDESFGDAVRAYGQRLRGGDMGALPAILGLVVLFVVFSVANDTFLSALNMANLVTQAGAICVLAMGLIRSSSWATSTSPPAWPAASRPASRR